MRFQSIVLAVATATCASSSFAGFTVTSTLFNTANGLDQWRVVAVNTGGNTGTQVKGLEYNYSGSPVAFEVTDTTDATGAGDPDGIPDLTNLLSATRTRVRMSATASNNTFVGVTPDAGPVQPNAYANGAAAFSGAIANTGTTQASGAGFEIARIYVPTGTSGVFSGNIGGDVGTKSPFLVNIGGFTDYAIQIRSITPNPVPVVFGPIVSNGASFSTTVVVDGVPDGANTFLTFGQSISGVHDLSVTGGGSQSRTFVVSGIVDYALNGLDVPISFVAHCPGIFIPEANGTFTLHVTPEPAALGLIFVAPVLRRRR